MNQITNLYLILLLPSVLLSYGCGDKDTPGEAKEAKVEARWKDRLDNFTDRGIYRGDKRGNSELSQNNTENVHLIEPVWEYQTISAGIGRLVVRISIAKLSNFNNRY